MFNNLGGAMLFQNLAIASEGIFKLVYTVIDAV